MVNKLVSGNHLLSDILTLKKTLLDLYVLYSMCALQLFICKKNRFTTEAHCILCLVENCGFFAGQIKMSKKYFFTYCTASKGDDTIIPKTYFLYGLKTNTLINTVHSVAIVLVPMQLSGNLFPKMCVSFVLLFAKTKGLCVNGDRGRGRRRKNKGQMWGYFSRWEVGDTGGGNRNRKTENKQRKFGTIFPK